MKRAMSMSSDPTTTDSSTSSESSATEMSSDPTTTEMSPVPTATDTSPNAAAMGQSTPNSTAPTNNERIVMPLAPQMVA